MTRGWLFGAVATSILTGILFAAFPQWDLQIAGWFWDPISSKFPLSTERFPNLIRTIGDWIVWLILLTCVGALVVKLLFPTARTLMAPSIALYLISSFIIGPGLLTNVVLKPLWSRPRPNFTQQFAGDQHFQPWWKPGGDCRHNCSFVSGDAAKAFWLLAPASVTPLPVRPFALAAATFAAFGLSGLRVAFGRHFFTDVVFAGTLTIVVIDVCYRIFVRRRGIKILTVWSRLRQSLFQRFFHLSKKPLTVSKGSPVMLNDDAKAESGFRDLVS